MHLFHSWRWQYNSCSNLWTCPAHIPWQASKQMSVAHYTKHRKCIVMNRSHQVNTDAFSYPNKTRLSVQSKYVQRVPGIHARLPAVEIHAAVITRDSYSLVLINSHCPMETLNGQEINTGHINLGIQGSRFNYVRSVDLNCYWKRISHVQV